MNVEVGDKFILSENCPFIFRDDAGKVFEVYSVDKERYLVSMKCIENDDIRKIIHHVSYDELNRFFEKIKPTPANDETFCSVDDDYYPDMVNPDVINNILDNSEIIINTVFDNTTVVSCKLPSGFVITETSSCINSDNYSEEIGLDICINRIRKKLFEYEAYLLLDDIYRIKQIQEEDAMCDLEAGMMYCSDGYDIAEDCEYCPYLHECIDGDIW